MFHTEASTSSKTSTDQQLWVAATERGEEPAFAELYHRHKLLALTVARRICGNDAEDAVQAAFLSIWRSRGQYDAGKGPIGAWMMTVVRNRSIDIARMPRRHRESAAEISEGDLIDPVRVDELAAQQETARHLRTAVASLPPRQRAVVTLGYFGDLSQSEIASRLDVPLGTVKGRARAALRTLQPAVAA